MASPNAARAVLAFGDGPSIAAKQLAEASLSGGLAGLAETASKKFGLKPDSFDVCDACGKIETDKALQRALCMAGGGVCTLEIRERPVWSKMRGMGEQIKALSKAGSETEKAMEALEARVSARLEGLLGELGAQQRRSDSLARLVEDMALEQMSQRAVKQEVDSLAKLVEGMALEQMSERAVRPQVESLSRVVQDMALENIETRATLLELRGGTAPAAQPEALGSELSAKIEKANAYIEELRRLCDAKTAPTAETDGDSDRGLEDLRECAKSARSDVVALQSEVRGLQRWRMKVEAQEVGAPVSPLLHRRVRNAGTSTASAPWADAAGVAPQEAHQQEDRSLPERAGTPVSPQVHRRARNVGTSTASAPWMVDTGMASQEDKLAAERTGSPASSPQVYRRVKHSPSPGAVSAHWIDIAGPDFAPGSPPGIAYSKKSHLHRSAGKASHKGEGAAGTSFAWLMSPSRPHDRLQGSQSLPQLVVTAS